MVTFEQYITANNRYPDRLTSPELTDEKKANAIKLLGIINNLLTELGITNVNVTSGFRTSESNAATKGSAKHSLHMEGLAIDIADMDGSLNALALKRNDLLKKYGVMVEDRNSTQQWLHMDIGVRSPRALNVFIP